MARKPSGPEPCRSTFVELFESGGVLGWIGALTRDGHMESKALELSLDRTSAGHDRATLYAGNAVVLRVVKAARQPVPRAEVRNLKNLSSWKRVPDAAALTSEDARQVIAALPRERIEGEGVIQAALTRAGYWGFWSIARQPHFIASKDLAAPVNRARKKLYKEVVKKEGGRWPGKSSIVRVRSMPDALALDGDGRLLVIEAKWVRVRKTAKAAVVPDLTRAPFQAAFSAAFVRRWAARKKADKAIGELLDQRALLEPEVRTRMPSWKPGSPIVPTVVLAGTDADIEKVRPTLEARYPRILTALQAEGVDTAGFSTRIERPGRPEILRI